MSSIDWDINKYRDEHESDDHWELRRVFMERWKDEYDEERLVCLARVFANIELLGCRYPKEVMQEIARLSYEVAQGYRNSRKDKLKRTFVSASDAAEDRAKGTRREAGVVIPAKSAKIDFVPQGHANTTTDSGDRLNIDNNGKHIENDDVIEIKNEKEEVSSDEKKSSQTQLNDYFNEMMSIHCLDVKSFNENMFFTTFGKMVLLIRPWAGKYWNIQASCQACGLTLQNLFENNCYSLLINGKLLARATGSSKQEAKSIVEIMAWNRLREEVVSILVKEQFIAQGDARISVSEISRKRKRDDEFGTPVENSVATKMMQLMGWKGGGLGADSQGISEPIKPNLQMVNRAGLGSVPDINQLRRAALVLMKRYLASDTFDLDLVFSSEFSKEERAQLHQCAQKIGLASKSYGDKDRFLVVKKKLNPFPLVQAVIEKGGSTLKYQVFIPAALGNKKKM